jgi:hypothetical protein
VMSGVVLKCLLPAVAAWPAHAVNHRDGLSQLAVEHRPPLVWHCPERSRATIYRGMPSTWRLERQTRG